jgi:hypothetical protein
MLPREGDVATRKSINRMIDIWAERNIYTKEAIEKIRSVVMGGPSQPAAADVSPGQLTPDAAEYSINLPPVNVST